MLTSHRLKLFQLANASPTLLKFDKLVKSVSCFTLTNLSMSIFLTCCLKSEIKRISNSIVKENHLGEDE